MQAPHRAIAPRTPRERRLLTLLDGLWTRYRGRVEYARRYEALVDRHGATFLNDHVAFRTIGSQEPQAGIVSVSRVFEALGYRAAGAYDFPDKKLSAVHFQHENTAFPKLFVSQLKTWELSRRARTIIARSLRSHRPPFPDEDLARLACGRKPKQNLARVFSELPWDLPRKEDVIALNEESQYGAWVLLNGYEVNHFTASVDAHGKAELGDIDKTVAALRAEGVPMKKEIEGAKGSKLRQSATEAVTLPARARWRGKLVEFPWSYAYFELAERPWVVDAKTGRSERFEGFLGGQATNLFEMTRR